MTWTEIHLVYFLTGAALCVSSFLAGTAPQQVTWFALTIPVWVNLRCMF